MPDQYRDWVLLDATRPTWRLRYAIRLMVRTLPFLIAGYLVLNLLSVPMWSIYVALGGALSYVVFVLVASGDEMAETRLVQHGFPPGFGRHMRRTGNT